MPTIVRDDRVHAQDPLGVGAHARGRVASPGSMNVDWEERWNVERLRQYRLGRAREALAASDLGAVLLFDFNNIRYSRAPTSASGRATR